MEKEGNLWNFYDENSKNSGVLGLNRGKSQ
jgi:hypothetical protein